MRSSRLRRLPSLCLALLLSVALAPAATVANWKVLFKASTGLASSTSGLNTNSPVFGDAAETNDMDGVGVGGLFGTVGSPASVTLAVGETLTVSAGFTLTGGVSNQTGAYRFAVQNENGQFAANSPNNWGGGFMHTTGSTGSNTSLYQTGTGADFNYMSINSPATGTGPSVARSGTFNGNSTTAYTWTMTITRDSLSTVDIVSSIVGGPSSFSETFTEPNWNTSYFTFNAIGIQTTGQSDLEQLTLSDVKFTYTPIPEPTTALLGSLGLLALLRRRRN